MRMHLEDAAVRVLSYCLMTNHVHFILVPERADSLAVVFRRAHGAYAQSFNARRDRSGHLGQNRFYSCPMSDSHLWSGIRYVEANPLRAAALTSAVYLCREAVREKAFVERIEVAFQRKWRRWNDARERTGSILRLIPSFPIGRKPRSWFLVGHLNGISTST